MIQDGQPEMSPREIDLGGVTLTVPPNWHDITAELAASDAPHTLADPDGGVGALQFSFALHEGGSPPLPSGSDLLSLAREFGQQQALGLPSEEEIFSEDSLRGAGVSFHSGEDFIRVWYVSDGRSISRVTYVCAWGQHEIERPICEDIVRSMRF